jgi:hypothetical protein
VGGDWKASGRGSRLSAEDDINRLGVEAGREDGLHLVDQARRKVYVVGGPGLLVVEMGVRLQIRAIPRRAALES